MTTSAGNGSGGETKRRCDRRERSRGGPGMTHASRGTELFGRRVRELRRKRKLTQATVAERIACSQSHLSTIEWGERVPNLLLMIRLALALDCKVSDLTRVFDRADLRSMLPADEPPKMRRDRATIR